MLGHSQRTAVLLAMRHDEFVAVVQEDQGFLKFVREVSHDGDVQQVFLAEALVILKALWEIYQILQALGFFDWLAKWWATRKVRKAMHVVLPFREQAVLKVTEEIKEKFAA